MSNVIPILYGNVEKRNESEFSVLSDISFYYKNTRDATHKLDATVLPIGPAFAKEPSYQTKQLFFNLIIDNRYWLACLVVRPIQK